jgi:hypothetical protein
MILIKLPLFWDAMIIITLASGIGAFLLLLKAWKDGKEPSEGTIIVYPDDEKMFQEDDIDEFSPGSIDDFDRTLRILKLKNKLDQIEDERSSTKKEKL